MNIIKKRVYNKTDNDPLDGDIEVNNFMESLFTDISIKKLMNKVEPKEYIKLNNDYLYCYNKKTSLRFIYDTKKKKLYFDEVFYNVLHDISNESLYRFKTQMITPTSNIDELVKKYASKYFGFDIYTCESRILTGDGDIISADYDLETIKYIKN